MGRVLSVDALEDAGIEIVEKVAPLAKLIKESPQASILARHLLDFENIISKEHWNELDRQEKQTLSETEADHIVIPEKQPNKKAERRKYTGYTDKYDIKRCEANFEIAASIKRRADKIRSEDEQRWSETMKGLVFGRLIERARRQEGAMHKQKAENVVKRFRVDTLHQYCQKTFFHLTAPKPDLYFGFHAYVQGDNETGPLRGDDYVENFSVTRLSQLYEADVGFVPSPCKEFFGLKELKIKDLTCFPWAVCEWKHEGKIDTRDEKKAYYQAANGAAVCLTLFANAAVGGRPFPILHDIRPVVCMTFTGPKAKVWVAYVTEVEDGRYRYRMRCIWEGSLRNILDNVKLCVIIENLHFWAMNHLRPWLTSCIDQWRRSIEEREDTESSFGKIGRAATWGSFVSRDDGHLDDDDSYEGSDGEEGSDGDENSETEEDENDDSDESGDEDEEDPDESGDECDGCDCACHNGVYSKTFSIRNRRMS
ncbi:hypothetical protein BU23DRAFT_603781 [Bimuria novae-zelandiae CBS 107.79]|uniref:Uncharacterized protein n=1 Tax=Bimuria novae-zelandiae CBS 107.79 TaxID=1447943 RepID=A0A6A5UMC4_9PLEO|nr:hypothetical protein BU23DRAFT_603781 [Bimuria novae-zelandiae CBS 107.79]